MGIWPFVRVVVCVIASGLIFSFLSSMAQILLIREVAMCGLPFEPFDMQFGILVVGVFGLMGGILFGGLLGIVCNLMSLATGPIRIWATVASLPLTIVVTAAISASRLVFLPVVWTEEGHTLVHFTSLVFDLTVVGLLGLLSLGFLLSMMMLWRYWKVNEIDECLPD